MTDEIKRGLRYHFVCRGADGCIKWEMRKTNFIPDEGLNFHINNFYLGFPWYLGLIQSGPAGADVTFDAGDTAAKITKIFPPSAPVTNGWSEELNYTGRQLLVFSNTTVPASGTGIALSAAVVLTYTAASIFGGGFVIGSTDNTGPLYSEMSAISNPVTAAGDTVTATVEFDIVSPPV